MSSPATLTVDHVRGIVAALFPDDLTPLGRRALLFACDRAVLAHAERQRAAYCPVHGPCVDTGKCPNCDYSEQQRPAETRSSVTEGWTRCEAFDGEERCGLTAFTGRDICPVHAEDRAPARRMPDAVGFLAATDPS